MLQVAARRDAPLLTLGVRALPETVDQDGKGFARSLYLLEMFDKQPGPNFAASVMLQCHVVSDGPSAFSNGALVYIGRYVQPRELMLRRSTSASC